MENTNRMVFGEIGSGMSWCNRQQLQKESEQNIVIVLDPKGKISEKDAARYINTK